MQEQRRLLFTIIVATGFLWTWVTFFAPKTPKKPLPSPQVASTVSPTEVKGTPAVAPTASVKPTVQPSYQIRTTPLWNIKWSNISGVPTELTLKKYKQEKEEPVQVIPFISEAPPPLLWSFDIDGQTYSDENQIYTEAVKEDHKLVYERVLNKDIKIQKTYTWKDDQYVFDLLLEVVNRSPQGKKVKASTTTNLSFASFKAPSMFHPGDPFHVTSFINDETHLFQPTDLVKGKPFPTGDIRWAGVDSRYFLFSLIPVEAKWSELKTVPTWKDESLGLKTENLKQVALQYFYPPRDLNPSSTQRYALKVYAGPKDSDVLVQADPTLNRAIDFGNWLGHIARPIHKLLTSIYNIIPNYGIAIILLTVLVRLLMFPLAQMQAQSMKKMQQHKPQMDAIREKNKDNKEAQSRDLMNYMKQHRINPMGGCLLLLPQLPIFFSLYRVIYNSIELRQAPFFGWIHDLSMRDPYFVIPVLLAGVMFYQQKITPSPGMDPAQAKMMKFMPVMFCFFMLSLPAGLNLYILISTLWGIGQQLWVTKGTAGNPAIS